jgi:hypothetical protein
MTKRLFLAIDRYVLGSLGRLIWANRKVNASLAGLRTGGLRDDDPRLTIAAGAIEEAHAAEIRRLQRIEDKAMNNVFVVAIAISILTAGIGFYGKDNPLAAQCSFVKGAAGILLTLAMSFLLLSAILAFRGYRIVRLYEPDLNDRSELCEDKKWKQTLLQCIELNRKVITIQSNYVTASIDYLIRGLIVAGFFFLLILRSAF